MTTLKNKLTDLIERSQHTSAQDAEKFAILDKDLCMLCFAYGADKRSVRFDCGYDVKEVAPEFLDVRMVEQFKIGGYYLLICKSCRGRLLRHIETWRNECVEKRDLTKDHDGYPEDEEHEGIPVRMYGVVVMMTPEQYQEYKEKNR